MTPDHPQEPADPNVAQIIARCEELTAELTTTRQRLERAITLNISVESELATTQQERDALKDVNERTQHRIANSQCPQGLKEDLLKILAKAEIERLKGAE